MIDKKVYYNLKYEPRESQIDILDFVKNQIRRGKKYMLINSPTGTGKAQPLYSKILTPGGWKKLLNLSLGDEIITPEGSVSKIIQLHPIEKLDIFKISFMDGRKIECTENHLWKVHSHDWSKKWKIVDTKYLYSKMNKSSNKLHIPLVSKNIYKKNIDLPLNPYLLGCLLGDGGITKNITISSMDSYIIDKLKNIVRNYDMVINQTENNCDYRIVYKKGHKNPIKEILKNIELHGKKSENKFIPQIYKESSFEQKIELINGLLDTDGTVDKNGGSISFSSCSLRLIEDLQEIIWSIGGIAKIKNKKTNYKYKYTKNIKKHYILYIRYNNPKILLSLPRKVDKISENYQYKNLKLKIEKIEKINKKEDCRCITIDSEEQLYITNNFIVTHNSFFAIMFTNWYLNYINNDAKFDIITNSKILQRQYTDEFPFISSLKGKSNYTCDTYNCTCQEGKEMNKALKRSCNNCPYDLDLDGWLSNRIRLTNFHLFDSFHLFVPGHLERKQTNVLIVDEADNFESVLCDYISMKLSERSLKLLGFKDTKIIGISKELKNVKSIVDYFEFINEYFLLELSQLHDNMNSLLSNMNISQSEKLKIVRNLTNITNAIETYKKFIDSVNNGNDSLNNWVIEKEYDEKNTLMKTSYLIQPIWSRKYLKDVIFKHYDHIIFMSGTILDKDIFAYLNGLEPNLCSYYSVGSPFPVKNRPIYFVKGIGKMTFHNKQETWEKQKSILDKIIKKYKDKKGIIHTTNYEISRLIEEYYRNDSRFLFHTSENRDEVLKQHISSVKPTIIVSPSMMQGVDLKDELSRFQVIMKIPYPNIKSNKIKNRQQEYKAWYSWKTCADLIQMYGRSIRSGSDYSDTYILDDSFSSILKFNYEYLPQYFMEAIKILKI